jgi:hypothetical protein
MKHLLTGIMLCGLAASAYCDDSVRAALDKAKPSVVRVTAISGNENGTTVIGTGFIYADKQDVVTAYHLIVGAQSVMVRLEGNDVPERATVSKVLRKADIALLVLDQPADADPLTPAATPDPGSQVLSLGHAYGADALESLTEMKIREVGGGTLDEMLGEKDKEAIQTLGFPDTTLELLNLEANPAPGFSGSPVLDTDGNVVGIIDGGIEQGAGAVSWAIPVAEVATLMQQPDYVPDQSSDNTQQTSLLYGADLRTTSGDAISVNGFSFVHRRTRSLQEMEGSTEDPRGLQQILTLVGMNGIETDDMKFDIYEEQMTGACIVVPEGMKLADTGGTLAGSLDDGRFDLMARLETIPDRSQAEILKPGYRFERDVWNSAPDATWSVDPTLTYAGFQSRYDGTLVFRKAMYGARYSAPWKYAFETFAIKGLEAMEVAAINNVLQPPDPDAKRDWAELVLSVHLSQFAPSVAPTQASDDSSGGGDSTNNGQ